MRVLVATPTTGSIVTEAAEALFSMDRAGCECDMSTTRLYDVARARNKLAQRAVDGGYDWLLFVDSDVVVPRDALSNLLEHGVDFVSGHYLRRSGEGRTCICRSARESEDYTGGELAAMREDGRHLLEVHRVGMGCSLVRVESLKRLKRPWFHYESRADGTALSEDYWFCANMRDHGIMPHVDTRVACGHQFSEIRS